MLDTNQNLNFPTQKKKIENNKRKILDVERKTSWIWEIWDNLKWKYSEIYKIQKYEHRNRIFEFIQTESLKYFRRFQNRDLKFVLILI